MKIDMTKAIKDLQEKLPEFEINEKNYCSFYLLYTERLNCKNCKSLDECKNDVNGSYTSFENGRFCNRKCDYKLRKTNTSIIKTLYMPSNILSACIEDFDMNTMSRQKIYKNITGFITSIKNGEKTKGLYLYSGFSTGKTYTLGVIANELSRNNIESLLIYFPDLIIELKNSMNQGNRYEELINMLKSVPVLMLDDFGSENMTSWVRDEILGPVINYRMNANKPMFFSSNISPSDLKEHLMIEKTPQSKLKAERIISRLQSLVSSVSMDDNQKYDR